MLTTQPVPQGFHTVTPFLMVREAHRVIDFLKRAFGADEVLRLQHSDGRVWHSQMRIGDSMIMLGDVRDEHPPMPGSIHLYLPNVDAAYQLALKAGGTPVMEPENQFYGDRSGGVRDPVGNVWWVGTHIEDVPREEMERRAQEMEGAVAS